MDCNRCTKPCIKRGIRNNIQQYYCRLCKKYQRASYQKRLLACKEIKLIISLSNEGVGIRGIARITKRSASTIVRHIKKASDTVRRQPITETGAIYEIDEVLSFVGKKTLKSEHAVWIMYALNKNTRQVVNFIVGRRSKENLKALIDPLLRLKPKRICTDRLNLYNGLIHKDVHFSKPGSTNYIERNNLTLRTHIKRLARRTICYSKSETMLEATLKIYFAHRSDHFTFISQASFKSYNILTNELRLVTI